MCACVRVCLSKIVKFERTYILKDPYLTQLSLSLPNSALKMMELIVKINCQRVGNIATSAGKCLKMLLTATQGGFSDRHVIYILDLTDKMLENVATMKLHHIIYSNIL